MNAAPGRLSVGEERTATARTTATATADPYGMTNKGQATARGGWVAVCIPTHRKARDEWAPCTRRCIGTRLWIDGEVAVKLMGWLCIAMWLCPGRRTCGFPIR